MQCKKCNNQILDGQDKCNACGEPVGILQQQEAKAKSPAGKIIAAVVGLAVIGFAIYNVVGNVSVQKNDEALDLLDKSGDYQSAINKFQEAANNAQTNDDKITIGKNLGYAYWMDNKLEESKKAFSDTLPLTEKDSFDYYLISAEIALLNNDATTAEKDYYLAYEKQPNDFQINSSLGVFYMGIDTATQDLIDYNKALKFNEKSYEVNKEAEISKENLANNYFFLERYQDAINLYMQTTLDSKPFNNYMIGLSYYGLGDNANAKKYLQIAKDKGFEFEPEAETILTELNQS